MVKLAETGQWKSFKRSLSQLSLSGKLVSDLTEMNVDGGPGTRRPTGNFSSLMDTDSDSDRPLARLFSPASTAEFDAPALDWGNSEVVSLAPSFLEDEGDDESDDCSHVSDVPPRLYRREGHGLLPPRKHPYPASFKANYKTFRAAASVSALRQMFLGAPLRRGSVIYLKRFSACSLAPASKPRGLKGFSVRIRRAFRFHGFGCKKNKCRPSVLEPEAPAEAAGTARQAAAAAERAPGENLYTRVLRAAMELDLDEPTVGSLIMMLGEDPAHKPLL